MLGKNHSVMPCPTSVPVSDGAVTGVGTGRVEVLGPTGGDVAGAGAGALGIVVDADTG